MILRQPELEHKGKKEGLRDLVFNHLLVRPELERVREMAWLQAKVDIRDQEESELEETGGGILSWIEKCKETVTRLSGERATTTKVSTYGTVSEKLELGTTQHHSTTFFHTCTVGPYHQRSSGRVSHKSNLRLGQPSAFWLY